MIAQKTNPLVIQTYLHICRVIVCVGVFFICPGGTVQPRSPEWWLCPVGITCHGAESLIDASCFLGGNYSVEMSRPNLWLCNVDTQARGNGDTAAPEELTHWFGQQMWGASFERAGLKWGDLIKRCNFYSVKQLKFMPSEYKTGTNI